MPYVMCPSCAVTSYVVRTSLNHGDPCPSCDEPLPDRATVISPARPAAVRDTRARRGDYLPARGSLRLPITPASRSRLIAGAAAAVDGTTRASAEPVTELASHSASTG
jgi:hypothetical protein